jgi:hypothetical protein
MGDLVDDQLEVAGGAVGAFALRAFFDVGAAAAAAAAVAFADLGRVWRSFFLACALRRFIFRE